MSSYSPEQLLNKFGELHRRLAGADRSVSIAKVSRFPGPDPFEKPQAPAIEETPVTPPPIVKDTVDRELLATIGRSLGPDEKIFVFLADSLVERKPIATLGERVEALLASVSGQGRGGVRYGSVLYSISAFYATDPLVGVVPQWVVVAKAIK